MAALWSQPSNRDKEETYKCGSRCLYLLLSGVLASLRASIQRSEVTGLSMWFKYEHFQEESGVSLDTGQDFVYVADTAKDVQING